MNLPSAFTQTLRDLLGEAESRRLTEALATEPPVSIRLNPHKPCADPYPDGGRVPWCEAGRYLSRRPSFTFDPLFHAGCYYVQEASSMFVEQALRRYAPDGPVAMLDLCAAPGGKSTHALSLLPAGSLLVANEVVRSRAQVLAENLTKWGHPGCIVTQSDPADFGRLPAVFDILLTDVPCSGEGMFRKDPTAIDEWSEANVALCSQRQRRILADAWPCLKPGGLLVYSTCTYNTQEDEENVAWICRTLGAEPLALTLPEEWNVTGSLWTEPLPVCRFLPHRTRGEGFFLAVMRKSGEAEEIPAPKPSARKESKGKRTPTPPPQALRVARTWLNQPDAYDWSADGNDLTAFPLGHKALLDVLRRSLRIVQAGVAVGEVKGKDLIPHQALAMSLALRRDAFPQVEVGLEQAVAYLRKEAVTLPADAPKGFVLLTYRQMPLGFAKNLGNRANNLYPQAWRIRSQLYK